MRRRSGRPFSPGSIWAGGCPGQWALSGYSAPSPRTLELEDPEDILNCGIEIKVQPPGKALKIITLLSGGEKAFVAIALYFAILKVRPTPFVVMDEIEARDFENWLIKALLPLDTTSSFVVYL